MKLAILVLALATAAPPLRAQGSGEWSPADPLARGPRTSWAMAAPYAPGEELVFRAVSGRFGGLGTATMRVEGPLEVRGSRALALSFDFRGRVGLFRVSETTRSWIAEADGASLRFHRRESSPLGSHHEEVEIFPDERRWVDAAGREGISAAEVPLDELSFLYFLRSLPLDDGEEYTLARHFDTGRNPVRVRVLGRQSVEVPAGSFSTIAVEMRVSGGHVSTMKLHLTDDARRIPVRIESSAPWVGSTRLVLERASTGPR